MKHAVRICIRSVIADGELRLIDIIVEASAADVQLEADRCDIVCPDLIVLERALGNSVFHGSGLSGLHGPAVGAVIHCHCIFSEGDADLRALGNRVVVNVTDGSMKCDFRDLSDSKGFLFLGVRHLIDADRHDSSSARIQRHGVPVRRRQDRLSDNPDNRMFLPGTRSPTPQYL